MLPHLISQLLDFLGIMIIVMYLTIQVALKVNKKNIYLKNQVKGKKVETG